MSKPIFVIGWRRTGTTWLGTLLSQHSRVAAVMGGVPGEKGGIVESAYFSHLAGKYGNLEIPNNLIQLIEIFSASTYFDLSGVDKAVLYKAHPTRYEDLFRLFMETFAAREGKDCWIEKNPAHSFCVEEISRYYPDALFVAIDRDIVAQVNSSIKLQERIHQWEESPQGIRKIMNFILEILGYHAAYKNINHFATKCPDKIHWVHYEDLLNNRETVIRDVCKFLELSYEKENLLESKYEACSSFNNKEERGEVLTESDIRLVCSLSKLFGLLPYLFYRFLYLVKRKMTGHRLPFWFFSTQIERYGWEDVFGDQRTPDLAHRNLK